MTQFQTTTAQVETCLRCKATILTAWSEGLRVRVDLTGVKDENRIRAEGRQTYTLTRNRQLIHRDAARIAGRSLRGPIVPEHRCDPTKTTQQPAVPAQPALF